ncbi:hypothetical protein MTR67_031375 [Solanum verrucosum]|uniref:Chromo domain-containing protein n=1 Tax=Solanum verrucosum TaxID=315347 RepID=A0AAF0U2B3_SOLVR|nr:hypothetical protein MTR67_031375 [Solanum verrucosum]
MKGVMRLGTSSGSSGFIISMLKKCIGDPSLIPPTKSVRINDSLSYEEIPVQILDRQVRRLRMKDVASVKVLWRNQFVEEATWEAEEDMKKRYPYLFESGGNADQGVVLVMVAKFVDWSFQRHRVCSFQSSYEQVIPFESWAVGRESVWKLVRVRVLERKGEKGEEEANFVKIVMVFFGGDPY